MPTSASFFFALVFFSFLASINFFLLFHDFQSKSSELLKYPNLKVTLKVAKKKVPFKAKTIKKFRAPRRAGGHPLHPRFSGDRCTAAKAARATAGLK
jgi:hypothetical protein